MIEELRQHLIEHNVLDIYCEAILHNNIMISSFKVHKSSLFGSAFSFIRANQHFKTKIDWYYISNAWSEKIGATVHEIIPFDMDYRRELVEKLKGGSKTKRLLRHIMR